MNARSSRWALCALAAAALPALAGTVEVKFTDADRYADAGISQWDQSNNLKVLSTYLQQLGSRYLPQDQKLGIEVLDVDLAGEKRWRRGDEIRIVRGRADWPRITLRYTLQDANGQTIREAKETVSDMDYRDRSIDLGNTDPLRYEKRMLEDWFRKSFAPQHARAGG
jgi:hypothetical protein